MPEGGTAPGAGGEEARATAEISPARVEAAKQSRALTTALGGTCVAVFTFLLFFLYPRFVAGDVDPILFQVTLLVIVTSIYLLVAASWFFFVFTQAFDVDLERTARSLARADTCFAVSVVALTLAPALVLFTVHLLVLGFVALGLWSIYVVVFLWGIRDLARMPKRRRDMR